MKRNLQHLHLYETVVLLPLKQMFRVHNIHAVKEREKATFVNSIPRHQALLVVPENLKQTGEEKSCYQLLKPKKQAMKKVKTVTQSCFIGCSSKYKMTEATKPLK